MDKKLNTPSGQFVREVTRPDDPHIENGAQAGAETEEDDKIIGDDADIPSVVQPVKKESQPGTDDKGISY